jgi:hypothetical protein
MHKKEIMRRLFLCYNYNRVGEKLISKLKQDVINEKSLPPILHLAFFTLWILVCLSTSSRSSDEKIGCLSFVSNSDIMCANAWKLKLMFKYFPSNLFSSLVITNKGGCLGLIYH